MVIQHSNYYQSWSRLGRVQSFNVAQPSAPASSTALGSENSNTTHRNDWRIVGRRNDWLATAVVAPVTNTALWTTLGLNQVTLRNDWLIFGRVSNGIAQAEDIVIPPPIIPPSTGRGGGGSGGGGGGGYYYHPRQASKTKIGYIEDVALLEKKRLLAQIRHEDDLLLEIIIMHTIGTRH